MLLHKQHLLAHYKVRMSVGAVPAPPHELVIQGRVVATNLTAKVRTVDLYSFPTVYDLICADGQIRPPFVSTRICSKAFHADFLYRWLLVEPKHVVLKPYVIHKELSSNRIFVLRSRVSAIGPQSQMAYCWP